MVTNSVTSKNLFGKTQSKTHMYSKINNIIKLILPVSDLKRNIIIINIFI